MGFPQRSSGRRSFGRSKRLSMARSLDDLEVRFLKCFSFSPDIDLYLSLSFSFILAYKISQHSDSINRRVGNDYIRNEWPTLYFRDERHACKLKKTNTVNPLDVRTLGALFTKQQLCACRTDLTPQRGYSSVLMAMVTLAHVSLILDPAVKEIECIRVSCDVHTSVVTADFHGNGGDGETWMV